MFPRIVTITDYDGYFTNMVQRWCHTKGKEGTPFKSAVIEITAGSYRSNAVTCASTGDTLRIDFYAALRKNFGTLTNDDINAIINEWL